MIPIWQFKGWLTTVAVFAAVLAGYGNGVEGTVKLSGKPAPNVIVSIEGVRAKPTVVPASVVMEHRDLAFTPHIVVVQVGESVRFENKDGMPCRIYSISKAKHFLLRPQDRTPGEVTFDNPGVVEVRCADHGRMGAYIVVKENPYFALTDREGRYLIPSLPAGRHILQAWYEGSVIGSKAVTVQDRVINADFQAVEPPASPRGVLVLPEKLLGDLPVRQSLHPY